MRINKRPQESKQCVMPTDDPAKSLQERIRELSSLSISVQVVAESAPLAIRLDRNRTLLTIHPQLIPTEEFALVRLVRFIETGNSKWVESFRPARVPPSPPPRSRSGRSAGSIYDLKLLCDRLNSRYFNGELSISIQWGTAVGKQKLTCMNLGTYDHRTRVIRIHPHLDRPEVPRFYLEFVIFHEMVHAAVGIRNHRAHGPEFRRLERLFPYFDEATRWEKANLGLILSKPQMRLFS